MAFRIASHGCVTVSLRRSIINFQYLFLGPRLCVPNPAWLGDSVYYGATPTLGGTIINIAARVLTIDTTVVGGSVPGGGDFICSIKNSVAESHGVRGHYLEYTLTNTSTEATELFAVKSSIFKSYP